MRILKKIGFALVALVLFGAIYQFIGTKLDENNYPPPGKMVDVGGYRLHLNETGAGTPTVILLSGLGCTSTDWALVQPAVEKFAHVCSYDRAGYGWSDESPLARTSQNIVDELHTLLNSAGVLAPYILVGHSFGGINARLFASKFPDEVAGMVLVDSSHEDQLRLLPTEPQKSWAEILFSHPRVAVLLAHLGAYRLLNHFPDSYKEFDALPSNIREVYLSQCSAAKYTKAVVSEWSSFEESANQLRAAGGLLDKKPLIVITAGLPQSTAETGFPQEYLDESDSVWLTLQKDLASKSTRGKQWIAEHSDHGITRKQPAIIVEAIRQIIHDLQ